MLNSGFFGVLVSKIKIKDACYGSSTSAILQGVDCLWGPTLIGYTAIVMPFLYKVS